MTANELMETAKNNLIPYINKVLFIDKILGVRFDGDITNMRRAANLDLYAKLLSDEEYRKLIVDKIATYAVEKNIMYYKGSMPLLVRAMKQFLDPYQIILLANYFDKNLEQSNLDQKEVKLK